MVDREPRNQLALALKQLLAGEISTDTFFSFEVGIGQLQRDLAVAEISLFAMLCITTVILIV
jgi:hypothetical protein